MRIGGIVIDPAVASGRPVVRRIGVPTTEIAERHTAGEAVEQLARDYSAAVDEIEKAIRCELELRAAGTATAGS